MSKPKPFKCEHCFSNTREMCEWWTGTNPNKIMNWCIACYDKYSNKYKEVEKHNLNLFN